MNQKLVYTGRIEDCHISIRLNQRLREEAINFSATKTLILTTPDWKSYFCFIINHNMSDEIVEAHS